MVWIVRATDEVRRKLGVECLDGEMYEHFFKKNLALVDKQYCYRFFMRKGFEDITPAGMREISFVPKKVLILRWGGLGDVLVASCMIESLRASFPTTEIHWLGGSNTSSILMGNPHITSQLTILPHEVGLVMDQFDQVYDISQAIECNSEATYTNPYDMVSSWTGISLPEQVRPYVYLTDEELSWGRDYLKESQFNMNEPIVGLAVESSAPRRTWPAQNSRELAQRLRGAGVQVVLFGMYSRLDMEDTPGILNTIGKIRDPRVSASLIRLCSLVVSPFTAQLHLSQAFGYKPLLILAGPWYGPTEAKYYPRAQVIQGEYKCAPCFRLGGPFDLCELNPVEGIGMCMKAISVDQVFDKVQSMLAREKLDAYPPLTPSMRPCPAGCKGDLSVYTAYGKYFYLRCGVCKSVFINRLPNAVFYEFQNATPELDVIEIKEASKLMNLLGEKLSALGFGSLRRVFEIGCGSGAFLNGCKKAGRIVRGIEMAQGSGGALREHYEIDIEEADFDTWDVPQEHVGKYQVVILRHVLEHFNDPFGALMKCNRLLDASGGLIYLLGHDGSQLTGVSDVRRNYVMLGGNFPGEHIVLFSPKGLSKMVVQAGLKIEELHPGSDGQMWGILSRCQA